MNVFDVNACNIAVRNVRSICLKPTSAVARTAQCCTVDVKGCTKIEVTCWRVRMDVVGAAPWAGSVAPTRALRPAPPDLCFGSSTASSLTTAARTGIHWASCHPCRITYPTAAVSVATSRNWRYGNRHFASKHGSIQELKIIHSLHFFRRVRKVAKSDYYLRRVCLSVCLPVRPSAWNNSALIERILIKFDIWTFPENLSRKFKFHTNLTRITGTLHEDVFTSMTTSRWIIFRMRCFK